MENMDLRGIVEKIIKELGNINSETGVGKTIPVEASARHVHLSESDLEVLFGKGTTLTKKRDLSQPGEFLAEQRVKIVTEKGVIENVAVLGPVRRDTQVEISLTDSRALGLNSPLNLSGNLNNAATAFLVGSCGMIEARSSVIVAKCHIHMNESDAQSFGVEDGQHVSVKISSERPVTFEDVLVRVNPSFKLAMHIDFDEANACMFGKGDFGLIMKADESRVECRRPTKDNIEVKKPDKAIHIGKLVTEKLASELVRCDGRDISLPHGTIVTPAAKDVFHRNNKTLRFI